MHRMTVEGIVLLREEAEFISLARECSLATVYPDASPARGAHRAPSSTSNRLVFASERDTQKIRNIEANPLVAVCFDEYHEDWSQLVQVVVQGEAYILDAGSSSSAIAPCSTRSSRSTKPWRRSRRAPP